LYWNILTDSTFRTGISLPTEYQVPALFGVARQDDLIHPRHSETLALEYGGNCSLTHFDGDHNEARPLSFLRDAQAFILENFQRKGILPPSKAKKSKGKPQERASFTTQDKKSSAQEVTSSTVRDKNKKASGASSSTAPALTKAEVALLTKRFQTGTSAAAPGMCARFSPRSNSCHPNFISFVLD
jgi:hypothetical protein